MSNSTTPTPTGKINSGLAGFGAPTVESIEERAVQLARIDGRKEANEADRTLAQAELQGAIEPQSPEATPPVEEIVMWDEAPGSFGTHAPQVHPDDDAQIGEVLIEEGVDEADHDSRLAAAEEEPEDEA